MWPATNYTALHRSDFAHNTRSNARDRKRMIVLANRHRIGPEHELNRLALRHLALIQNMPLRARLASSFAARQLRAYKIDACFLIQRTRKWSPLHVLFFVNVPMIAIGANQAKLPSIVGPRWRVLATGGRVSIGQPDTRGAGRGTIGVFASYNRLQIHRV